MDRVFPVRYRTNENLDRIAQMAQIYGIDAKDMRRYVQRSINPSTHVFDLDKLKEMVMRNVRLWKQVKIHIRCHLLNFCRINKMVFLL